MALAMGKDAKYLHNLVVARKKKTQDALDKALSDKLQHAEALEKHREAERKIRDEKIQSKESQRQKETSALLRELLAVTKQPDTPSFVYPLVKVLDNFGGNFSTIRGNGKACHEKIILLWDTIRSGNEKNDRQDDKIDKILSKVLVYFPFLLFYFI